MNSYHSLKLSGMNAADPEVQPYRVGLALRADREVQPYRVGLALRADREGQPYRVGLALRADRERSESTGMFQRSVSVGGVDIVDGVDGGAYEH